MARGFFIELLQLPWVNVVCLVSVKYQRLSSYYLFIFSPNVAQFFRFKKKIRTKKKNEGPIVLKSLKTGGRNGSFDTVVQIIVALIIPSSGECQVLSAAVPVFVLYGLSNGPVHFIIDISIRNLLSSSLWPVSQLFLSCFVSNNSTTKSN